MRAPTAFLLLLSACASAAAPSRAPDGDLKTLEGKAVAASSLWSEKPVLLVFMTAW